MLRPLPALILALGAAGVTPPPAGAQTTYRVTHATAFRQDAGPQGKELATVAEGVEVVGGDPSDGWVRIELDGWIWGASVTRTNRDGHNLAVSASRGENLRVRANGDVMARLLSGFLLDEVSRDGAWVRVRRAGWLPVSALVAGDLGDVPAGAPPGADSVAGSPGAARSALDRAVTLRRTAFTRLPGADSGGALAAETPVRVLARNGEWVRVQTEGWVRESDLRSGAQGVLVGVTAAELRTRPQDFENKLVQWNLQFLALNVADELRPEIPLGRKYLLTRGPLPEASFVYVSLDDPLLREAERLPPLAQFVAVVRIKTAKTRYLGNPVVELVEMRVKQ